MKRFRTRAVSTLTVIGLLGMSGVALASSDDDTVFNHGYDLDSQFFIWNVTSLDYDPDPDALESSQSTTEGGFEALLEACGLEAAGAEGPLEYGYTVEGDSIEVYDLSEGAIDPEDDDAIEPIDCAEFVGGDVTGPSGQVNHGMFLRLFNKVYEGENRGCLVRQIARSGLGKDDQQIEADPELGGDDSVETIEDGHIRFNTTGADCVRGPDRDDEVDQPEEDTDRRGPPQFVKDKFGGDRPGRGNGGDGPGNGHGKPEGTPGEGRP